MTGAELIAGAMKLYGQRGHITALANALDIDRTQVWRYSKLDQVPGPVAAAMACWLRGGEVER